MTPPPPLFQRRDFVAFWVTFLAALAVYIYWLPPSINLEDGGELAVAADYLGVPHPPGYPIWTLLAWFFQWVLHPLQYNGYPNPAWPIAFMSAFFAALACGLIALLACRSGRMIVDNLPRERFSLRQHLPARIVGLASGLLICMLLQAGAGIIVLLLGGLLILATLLEALTPSELRKPGMKYLPRLGTLGAAIPAALLSSLCWLAAWTYSVVPSPAAVLLLAIAGLIPFLFFAALLDFALGISARRLTLAEHFRSSAADVLTAIGAGLMLAFTPLMGSQAVIIEVYSLNAFFMALLLVLSFAYLHRPGNRLLYTIGFLFALGLTNHQSLVFLIFFLIAAVAAARNRPLLKDGLFLLGLGILAFFLFKARQYGRLHDGDARAFFLRQAFVAVLFLFTLLFTRGGLFRTWRQLLTLLALGLLGLSFHFFMPVASEQNPPMNWSYARSKDGFLEALTRGQYEKISAADNVRMMHRIFSTPTPPELLDEDRAGDLGRTYATRTLFVHMLGAYFWNPTWKYSIASQFSAQLPRTESDPDGVLPPPPEKQFPLALIGLLPLFAIARFDARSRAWFHCTFIAFFFLSVVFIILQWPELNHNDLWVKRVQYLQAHALFAYWMSLGAVLLLVLLHALIPRRSALRVASVSFALLAIAFPLHKDIHDPRHIDHLGASNFHGHDFGWRFGFHALRGVNGILLDEIAHHKNPPCRLDDSALAHLRSLKVPEDLLTRATALAGTQDLPLSDFKRRVLSRLDNASDEHKRLLRDAALLAAFRANPPAELRHLHRLPPDLSYPPEMEPSAILFGGTDPGRFVPTYMVFSAEVRPDVFVLTQNALAHSPYLDATRDLYGDRIWIPDLLSANDAFRQYGDHLRMFDPDAYEALIGGGGTMAVTGVNSVNEINSTLAREIVERNKSQHAFYVEESYLFDWMTPYLRPQGLLFKLESKPVTLTTAEMRQSHAFWDWYIEHLMETHLPLDQRNGRFRRDLMARKTFSKLRQAQAWNYFERGHLPEAEAAMLQALQLYPANPETAFRAADMYTRMLRFDDAERVINTFAPHDPTNRQIPLFHRTLATLRDLERQRQEKEADFALKITGNLTLQLLQIYSHLELKEQRNEMAELLLRLPNLDGDFYIHLAAFMRNERDSEFYPRALAAWSKHIPDDPRPELDLAAASLSTRNYEQAFRHMQQAIQRDPIGARMSLANDPRFREIAHWQQFQRLIAIPPSLSPPPTPKLPTLW
jgi:tetratricopeptide (TPR) repeat protein